MEKMSIGEWRGYTSMQFVFEEREAIVVVPKGTCNGYLAVKTEYWDAFPEAIELTLLENGFHLCYIKNDNRWGVNDDLDRKARFVRFVQKVYRLNDKCVLIGLSCGGLIAIKFAARYQEMVQCMYLDAPVVNYMSCPCGFGEGSPLNAKNELMNALGLKNIGELLAYRDMPLDKLGQLVASCIPVVMVSGDKDLTVPYLENGIFLQQAYENAGVEIEVFLKPGGDHHPHGLENPAPAAAFILKHCR